MSIDVRAEGTRPLDRELPPVASAPSISHPATPRTTEPIPILPAATPGATADPPGAPPPATLEQDRDTVDLVERGALRMELDRVERELSHRLRALQIALAIATALLAAALAAGLWWTSKQLQGVDLSRSAPRETQSDPGASGRWLP